MAEKVVAGLFRDLMNVFPVLCEYPAYAKDFSNFPISFSGSVFRSGAAGCRRG
jgi:hypothetical protein